MERQTARERKRTRRQRWNKRHSYMRQIGGEIRNKERERMRKIDRQNDRQIESLTNRQSGLREGKEQRTERG